MEKIFTVAWEFPPSTNGESIVCNKTLKYSKYEYDLYRHFGINESYEGHEYEYPENIKVISIKGKFVKWSIAVIKEFIKKNKVNDYNIIHTRTMPPTAHFVGCIIKAIKPSIKWIIYFSDPFWNSPYVLNELKTIGVVKRVIKVLKQPFYINFFISCIFAKIAVRLSDAIVFNNKYLGEFVLGRKYGKYKDKVRIVPYGYDNEEIDNSLRNVEIRKEESLKDCIVIAHVGHMYGFRNFNILAIALEKLKVDENNLYKKIRIQQIGNIEENQIQKLKEMQIYDRFEILPPVDYLKSLAYMREADYLLTVDAKFEEIDHNIYIPSKIYDYLGARKPIVAITQVNGPTADIVRNTKNIIIDHDVNEMYDFLIKAVSNELDKPSYEKYSEYNCITGTEAFDKIIDDLL